jgi:FixJ family two-component response regulator
MRRYPFSNELVLPYSGTSVALIDDDALLRDALARLLEMTGMAVEQYESGEQFLAAAETSSANCVVIDVQLGDISGIEVARELHRTEPDFPIVFITGSIDPVFEQQADEIAGAAFLRKPFLRDTLIEAIMASMAGRQKSGAHAAGSRYEAYDLHEEGAAAERYRPADPEIASEQAAKDD